MNIRAERARAVLHKAQLDVARALTADFPEIYILSARAFDEPVASLAHYIKWGRYLLSPNSELGVTPVEALANGRSKEVAQQLAARGGLDPSSVDLLDAMARTESGPRAEDPGPPHIAYCETFTTEDGMAALAAVSGTVETAETTFRLFAPECFWDKMELDLLDERSRHETRKALQWIPESVTDLIAKNPPGTTHYFAVLRCNPYRSASMRHSHDDAR